MPKKIRGNQAFKCFDQTGKYSANKIFGEKHSFLACRNILLLT